MTLPRLRRNRAPRGEAHREGTAAGCGGDGGARLRNNRCVREPYPWFRSMLHLTPRGRKCGVVENLS
jgi:hypothetical protein